MNELKKLASEYFAIEDKCDGTSETFKALYYAAADLGEKAKALQRKARSRETRYFAEKLYQDAKVMENRFWKYTV